MFKATNRQYKALCAKWRVDAASAVEQDKEHGTQQAHNATDVEIPATAEDNAKKRVGFRDRKVKIFTFFQLLLLFATLYPDIKFVVKQNMFIYVNHNWIIEQDQSDISYI